jgi:hypothetical protein
MTFSTQVFPFQSNNYINIIQSGTLSIAPYVSDDHTALVDITYGMPFLGTTSFVAQIINLGLYNHSHISVECKTYGLTSAQVAVSGFPTDVNGLEVGWIATGYVQAPSL